MIVQSADSDDGWCCCRGLAPTMMIVATISGIASESGTDSDDSSADGSADGGGDAVAATQKTMSITEAATEIDVVLVWMCGCVIEHKMGE